MESSTRQGTTSPSDYLPSRSSTSKALRTRSRTSNRKLPSCLSATPRTSSLTMAHTSRSPNESHYLFTQLYILVQRRAREIEMEFTDCLPEERRKRLFRQFLYHSNQCIITIQGVLGLRKLHQERQLFFTDAQSRQNCECDVRFRLGFREKDSLIISLIILKIIVKFVLPRLVQENAQCCLQLYSRLT